MHALVCVCTSVHIPALTSSFPTHAMPFALGLFPLQPHGVLVATTLIFVISAHVMRKIVYMQCSHILFIKK
jgi:hypothetical protein